VLVGTQPGSAPPPQPRKDSVGAAKTCAEKKEKKRGEGVTRLVLIRPALVDLGNVGIPLAA
jgi:hypothetical protein